MNMSEKVLSEGGATTWQEGAKNAAGDKEHGGSAGETADVAIIGCGLAGLLTAYLLAKEGKTVTVFERGRIGDGVTAYTTAFLTEAQDTDYKDLISVWGAEDTRAIVESHRKAIDLVEGIVSEHGIECDFERCSNHLYANDEKDFEGLKEEAEHARTIGTQLHAHKDGTALGFPNGGYLELKDQAKFHPLKFLNALAEACRELGVRIHEHSEVADIRAEEERVLVKTEAGEKAYPWAVVATYEPFNEPMKLYFKKGTYVSYVFDVELPEGGFRVGMYEDTDNPYHYFRIDEEEDGTQRMILGGEDHRADIPLDETRSYNALQEYLKSILAGKPYVIRKRWKGPILEPVDGLAAIGSLDASRILYATGFSGSGMTYSAIAADILRDHVMGKKNPYAKIYDAGRLPKLHALMIKGRDFSEEFVHGALKNLITQSKKEEKPNSD